MVTALIIACVVIGLPVLCWIDPARHLEAERRKRQAEQ